MDDPKYTKALYDQLSTKLELGTQADFEKQIGADATFRKAIYDQASADLDLGDYATYDGMVKKKELSSMDAFTSASGKEELPFLGQSGKNVTAPLEVATPEVPQATPTDVETKFNNLLANSKQPKNPFIQPSESTAVKNDVKPLPKIPTLGDYLNERGVTLKQVGLPEDINTDRQLRDGEEEGFNSLLKTKGVAQPAPTSYFWGAGKEVHKVVSTVFRDLDDASKVLSDITGLKRGGAFKNIADFVDERGAGILDMPNTEVGRLLSGGIGLESLFIEMAISPEFKAGKVFGKTINISRFLTQMTGKGFVNKYAAEVDKGEESKPLIEGLKGAGEGALTATVFTKLGYGSSKLGTAIAKATGSGVAGGLTNAMANSAGFAGYTFAEMVATGQPIDEASLRNAAELGAVLAIPQFAQFAGMRATGNYLTSSPAAEKAAKEMKLTVPEARDKAFDIREKARTETDIQKQAAREAAANTIDGLADIKVIAEEVKKDPVPFLESIEQSDIPAEQQQILKDKVQKTAAEDISTPKIDKLQEEIDGLKKQEKGIKENENIPETIRKIKTEPIKEQITAKEEQIKNDLTALEEAMNPEAAKSETKAKAVQEPIIQEAAKAVGKTIKERKKRSAPFKPGSRTFTAVEKTPNDFDEAVLQYFVGGGRIKTQDLIDQTGYPRNSKDLNALFGLHSKEGTRLDVFHESLENAFEFSEGGESVDMINKIIDVIKDYPSKGKMLTELERRQKSEEFIQITDEEIAFEEKKLLAEERAQKIAKSHDVEESLKNGLITKSEYDEITEYLSKQAEQDRLAEEAFSIDLIGKGENIQEEGTRENPTQSEAKPVRTTDPAKQKQIEVIDKDADVQVVELKAASLANKKAKDKAIADAQERQGLFGDTKETGEAKMFSQEEQGFGLTPERLKSIEQPFKEKQAELNKEITRLNKERESKIGEILKQKTLDFNEPISDEKTEADKQPDITTGTEAGNIVPRGTETSPKPVEAKGKEEPVAATEVKVEGFTPKEVMNKAYRDFKAKKMGTKEIQEYFTQVDRLFNPNKTTVAEYRYNGVVVKEGDKYIFHALADMDTKTWREAGKFDVTEQFAEAKVDSRKLSLDKEEIKVGDYVNYGVDPRARGFNESQLTPYLQKVTGFREIGGLLYPTFDVPKGSKKKNFGYSSQEYTIIKDAEQLLSKKPELTENKPTEKKVELTKEEELKAKEISATKEGIKYGDKTYTERDQVQDDFDKFPSLQEYNKILDKVGKFEDGLRDGAKKASVSMDKKMGNSTKEAEDRMLEELGKKKGNDGKVAIRFLPPDPIPLLNTVLYKQLVKVRDALNNRIASVLQSGMKSQMDLLRWSSKALTNFWGGLGRTQADIHGKGGKPGKLAFTGTIKTYAKYEGKEIRQNLLDIIHSDMESSRRVLDVTDPDPNFAIEKLNVGDLSLAEKNLYFKARDWNTWTHETNYAIGMLDTETYLKNKDATGYSTYVARMYDKYENETLLDPAIQEFVNRGNSSITTKMLTDMYKAKGESTPWKKEHAIRDITYLTAKRVVETIQNVAVNDYQSLIIQEHPDFVLPVKKGEKAPDGYTQLGSSYSWGQFRNKAVINHVVEDFTGFYYSNAVANDIYNAFKKVDRTNVNQFYKKLRTVYNPIVQLGNATGDIFFASINGINPITFLRKSFEAKLLPKKNPEAYKALLKTGLIGDVAFTGEMKPLDAIKTKEGGILSKADEMATKAYVGTDNIAKISAYLVFREQGMSHEASVRRSYDAFQNYSTVGKTWDFTSKIPIIGPTFAKFQADLQRILVNAVTTTPLTLIGTLMLIKMAGILASTLSGESDEERKAREGRKGVAKIPFVNIPLSFKVGKSEVNVARYLSPLYNYNYADAGTQLSEVSKFLPIQFSKVNRPILGETANMPAFADATWGWIGAVAFDRDYRGISIQNPKASLYHNAPISNEERLLNAMTYIARSQVPFFKGAQDMYDGIRGNLDYYGRKRTWQQTILNNIIKIQEFDKPEIKSYVERNLDYLTSRFASLGQRMGDSNAEFIKTLKDAEKQGLSEAKLNQIYQDADKKRTTGIKISEEKMPVIMKEIEKLTTTYAKWYPDDPFLQENYKNIEAGKNSIFNVLNEVDLQKQYPKEYSLLKNNGLLNKPEIPKFFRGTALTDAEKKSYSNIYWSEYIRELDARVGLTQEEITELKDSIVRKEKADTPSGVKEVTRLEDIASKAASRARVLADRNFRTKK